MSTENAFGVPLDLLLEGGCSALEASYAGEDSCTVFFTPCDRRRLEKNSFPPCYRLPHFIRKESFG